jgi:integrase
VATRPDAWTAASLPAPTLHTGRHATVSRFIAAGLDVKAVQTYAWHSSARTTLDVYGHLFPSTIEKDRKRLDEHLRATVGSRLGGSRRGVAGR